MQKHRAEDGFEVTTAFLNFLRPTDKVNVVMQP